MKYYSSFLFLLLSLFATAQKDTSQQIDSKGIESIYIDTDEAFRINLKTTKGDKILIATHTEGEYFNDIALITETQGKSLHLSTKFRKILQSGYDKLSAHKVFSLEITIEIPEKLQVLIKSNIAAVEAQGVYDFLEVELNSGYCTLTNFIGNALINTYNGPISIETTNATVIASSRNGEVIIPSEFTGNHIIKASSINGNIRVVEN